MLSPLRRLRILSSQIDFLSTFGVMNESKLSDTLPRVHNWNISDWKSWAKTKYSLRKFDPIQIQNKICRHQSPIEAFRTNLWKDNKPNVQNTDKMTRRTRMPTCDVYVQHLIRSELFYIQIYCSGQSLYLSKYVGKYKMNSI
jgi:hypothetical protein